MITVLLLSMLTAAPEAAEAPTQPARLMNRVVEDLRASVSGSPERSAALDSLAKEATPDLPRLVEMIQSCFPDIDLKHETPLDWPLPADFPSRSEVAANLNLFVGGELVRSGLSEEGLSFLAELEPASVVDPARLHFFRAAAYFQLRRQELAAHDLDILANLPALPRRYADAAALMREQLSALDPESLTAIAHDMRHLSQRLGNAQTGDKVQLLERDVVDRLDALIEELEQQQRKQRAAGGSSDQPSEPMPDSALPQGPIAKGEVDGRVLRISSDWGKIPEKEREQAMQQLDRQFPGHYREAVEQYFRRLADTETQK